MQKPLTPTEISTAIEAANAPLVRDFQCDARIDLLKVFVLGQADGAAASEASEAMQIGLATLALDAWSELAAKRSWSSHTTYCLVYFEEGVIVDGEQYKFFHNTTRAKCMADAVAWLSERRDTIAPPPPAPTATETLDRMAEAVAGETTPDTERNL